MYVQDPDRQLLDGQDDLLLSIFVVIAALGQVVFGYHFFLRV